MERELIVTGIGGQGVQVATKILGRAAAARGMKVMIFGMFGGSVRGGRSETTLVVSDDEIEAPPIVPSTESAIALHEKFFDTVEQRIRPGGLALVNSSLFERPVARADVRVVGVPLTAIAEELGAVMLVSMVALGAYVALTGLVPLDAVVEAMREEIPSYRSHLIEANERAIARGADAVREAAVR